MKKDLYKSILLEALCAYTYQKVLFDSTGMPYDYEILEISPAFEKLAGCRAEDVNGKKASEVFPHFKGWSYEILKQCGLTAIDNKERVFEHYSQALGRWFRIKAFSPENGYFITLFSEITEEITLKETSNKKATDFKQLFENMNSAAIVYTVTGAGTSAADYIIKNINRAIEFEGQVSKDNLLGKSLENFSHSIESKKMVEIFHRVWKTGKAQRFLPETTYIGNRKIYFEARIFRLSQDEIVAVYDDVTETVNAQTELLDSRDTLAKYIEKAPIGIYLFDSKGIGLEANNMACSISGYSREELIGMSISKLLPEHQVESIQQLSNSMEKSGNLDADITILKKNGEQRQVNIRQIKISEGEYLGFVTDITEKKAFEDIIAESEMKYRAMFDQAAIGITFYDKTGKYINANQRFCEIVGYSVEELKNLRFVDITHPDDRDMSWELFQKRTDGYIGSCSITKRYIKKDGSTVYVLSSGNVVKAADGTHLYSVTTLQDITEQTKAQEQLIESEQRYRAMFDQAAIGISFYDKTGKYINANQRFCDIVGYSLDELKSLTFADITYPEDRDISWERFQKRVGGDLKYDAITKRYVKKDGTLVHVMSSGSVVKSVDGSYLYSVTTVQDITEQTKAQEQLIENEQRYRAMFDQATVGMFRLTTDGQYIEANRQLCEITGYSQDELKELTIFDITHPEDLEVSKYNFNKLIRGEKHAPSLEKRYIRKNGCVAYVIASSRVIYDSAGRPLYTIGTVQDITERMRAQNELAESEQRYRAMFNQAATGISSYDISGRYIDANKKFCDIVGYTLEELRGLSVFDITHPDDIEQGHLNLSVMAAGGTEHINRAVHKRYIRKDGRIATVTLSAAVVMDSKGIPLYALSTVQDITEQAKAQKELIESEQRYRAMFDQAAAGIVCHSPDGKYISANRKFCEMIGYTLDELKEKTFYDITHPDDMKLTRKLFDNMIGGKTDSLYIEKKYIRKDGCAIDIISSSIVVRGQDGAPLYTMATILDVTEHRRAERELFKSERIYRAMFDQAAAGIWNIDLKGRFTDANSKMCEILGYSLDELRGMNVLNITHPEDIAQSIVLLDGLVSGKTEDISMEKRYVRKDGDIIHALDSGSVIFDADGKPQAIVVMTLDITDKIALEQQKVEMESHLRNQQKLESIGILAGGVAHEINNPINGIMNYSQLILDTQGAPEEVREYAGEIIHESNRVSSIVKNLLQFSRQEKQSYSSARIEDIANHTISLIRTIIKNDHIELTVHMDEDMPSIKCRSQQIQQVLMNLLTNARDALNEKYNGNDENKRILVTCGVIRKRGRKWIRTIVEDSGNGIPRAIHNRIFDPFYTTKSKDIGTGLGLSISYGIVREHHGELFFETEEGEYTRFFLDLPVDNGWQLS